MKKLVIIPAYNEQDSILNVVNNLKEIAPTYDYIIINDCSKDDTEKVCKENNLNYVSLPQNLGIGGAMQTGYKYAKQNNYDIAIQIDGDGQHDAKYLDELVQKVIEGKDMCIGSRYIDKEGFQSSFMRRLGKNIISLWIKILCFKKITDPTSGFRACNKRVIEMFANKYPHDYPEPETIVRLLKNKYKIVEIPVIMKQRENGKSSITPIKSIKYMFKVIIAILFARLERKGRIIMILNLQLQITLIIASVIFLYIVLNASIKKKLTIKYSILWLIIAIFFLILSIWPNSILIINNIIKIREPIHAVFLIIIAFILLLVFTYNYIIAKLQYENRLLIQEIGIIKKRIDDLEKGEEK